VGRGWHHGSAHHLVRMDRRYALNPSVRLALAIRGVTSGWSSGTAPRSVLVPIAGSVPNGHDGDRTGDVFGEVFQVAGVTCVYVIAATSGGLDDDGINDVGGSGAAG
jgi:hypothetical protein